MTRNPDSHTVRVRALVEHVYNHLPSEKSKELERSVSFALWKLLVKQASLPAAIHYGQQKGGYRIRAHIERAVRGALPIYYLKNRATRREINPEVCYPESADWVSKLYHRVNAND